LKGRASATDTVPFVRCASISWASLLKPYGLFGTSGCDSLIGAATVA